MIWALIRDWFAERLRRSRDDPVWFMGRPWSPEQLEEIDRTYTGEF